MREPGYPGDPVKSAHGRSPSLWRTGRRTRSDPKAFTKPIGSERMAEGRRSGSIPDVGEDAIDQPYGVRPRKLSRLDATT